MTLVGRAPRKSTFQSSFLASAMAPMVSRITVPSTTRSQPSDFIRATWALKSEAPRLYVATVPGSIFMATSCAVKPSSTFLPYSLSWCRMHGRFGCLRSTMYLTAARVDSTYGSKLLNLSRSCGFAGSNLKVNCAAVSGKSCGTPASAVGDAHVALVVDHADVPGMQPAVAVDGLRGLLRL